MLAPAAECQDGRARGAGQRRCVRPTEAGDSRQHHTGPVSSVDGEVRRRARPLWRLAARRPSRRGMPRILPASWREKNCPRGRGTRGAAMFGGWRHEQPGRGQPRLRARRVPSGGEEQGNVLDEDAQDQDQAQDREYACPMSHSDEDPSLDMISVLCEISAKSVPTHQCAQVVRRSAICLIPRPAPTLPGSKACYTWRDLA